MRCCELGEVESDKHDYLLVKIETMTLHGASTDLWLVKGRCRRERESFFRFLHVVGGHLIQRQVELFKLLGE